MMMGDQRLRFEMCLKSLKLLLSDSWLAVLLKPFGCGVRPIAVLLDFGIQHTVHRGNKKYIKHVKITTYRRTVDFHM